MGGGRKKKKARRVWGEMNYHLILHSLTSVLYYEDWAMFILAIVIFVWVSNTIFTTLFLA